jgi:hypothetical protein
MPAAAIDPWPGDAFRQPPGFARWRRSMIARWRRLLVGGNHRAWSGRAVAGQAAARLGGGWCADQMSCCSGCGLPAYLDGVAGRLSPAAAPGGGRPGAVRVRQALHQGSRQRGPLVQDGADHLVRLPGGRVSVPDGAASGTGTRTMPCACCRTSGSARPGPTASPRSRPSVSICWSPQSSSTNAEPAPEPVKGARDPRRPCPLPGEALSHRSGAGRSQASHVPDRPHREPRSVT